MGAELMSLHRDRTGFTLVELLLYSVIVGSLLLGIALFFALASNARIKNQSVVEVDQQGAYVLDLVTSTIRNANSITSPAAGNTSSSLSLTVPTAGSSPTLFSLSNGAIQITEGAGSAIAVTSTSVVASDLAFTNLSRSGTNGLVRVSFTLSRTNNIGTNEYSYQKTFVGSAAVQW